MVDKDMADALDSYFIILKIKLTQLSHFKSIFNGQFMI